MPITLREVLEFCDCWLTTVLSRGTPAEQAAFFVDPESRLYMLDDGGLMTFQENYDLHCRLTNEIHTMGDFTVTVLNSSPDRARGWKVLLASGVCGETASSERHPSYRRDRLHPGAHRVR